MGMNIEIPDGQLFRGQAATLLGEMARRCLPPRRIIAIGRCQNGGAFTVTTPVQPPADFADAIADVLTPDRVPTVRMVDCEDEHIGEDFSTRPYLW